MVIEEPLTPAGKPMHSKTLPKPWIKTPLIYSPTLSLRAGFHVYLKMDLLQPSGSFKSRFVSPPPPSPTPPSFLRMTYLPTSSGIGNLVLHAHLRHPTDQLHFFSSSGGNAGLACIVAAATYGHPATVVCPVNTNPHMVAKLRAAGGHVVQHGESWMEADAEVRRLVAEANSVQTPGGTKGKGVYVPPFDHPEIWEGNRTMAEEVRGQLAEIGVGEPDAVVLSVGGGGMLVGMCRGLEMGRTMVVAVETRGADSLSASVERGEVVTLERITSIARTLGARRVAEEAFEWAVKKQEGGGVKCVVVGDEEAGMGSWRLAEEERIVVEASCGASAAAVYNGSVGRLLEGRGGGRLEDKVVVLVVCGGGDVNLAMLEDWRRNFGPLVPWMQESL
ncbi:tryptophan synthase beta subunit-like PLP-dependent enzyme [Ascobolus immersus RN42]|uniref:L-serine ammonia-lyase n=1 Tax=Ascobolus immersus RN42 TaxID=1160509 RepID=A0A3N4IIP9_ASCIM|nr:tryptophan synthase beta subunit-like PLP-dependent enzyme [Ascobolus immersus RN42]